MKEVSREQGTEMFQEVLSAFMSTKEEAVVAAGKVAAAREKGTSDKRYMSKLDQITDSLKDQLVEMIMDMFSDEIKQITKTKKDRKIFQTLLDLVDEGYGVVASMFKNMYLANATLSINAVLHPEKAKEDKKMVHDINLEFQLSLYNFAQTAINTMIDLWKDIT